MLFKKHENKLLVTSNLFDHGWKLYRCLDLTAYEEGEGWGRWWWGSSRSGTWRCTQNTQCRLVRAIRWIIPYVQCVAYQLINSVIVWGIYPALYAWGHGYKLVSYSSTSRVPLGKGLLSNVCFPIIVLILYCHVEYAILHRGLHVRLVLVSGPMSGHGQPQWWAYGYLYDKPSSTL